MIVRVDGVEVPRGDPATLLSEHAGRLVWVDVQRQPDDAELRWLAQAFHLHPLELDDLRERNERPKVDDYSDHLFVVLIGALRDESDGRLHLSELHIAIGPDWILTVHDRPLPAIAALASRCSSRPELAQGAAGVLFYRLCDATVDSYFPILDELDEEIDRLESSIIQRSTGGAVSQIFGLKRDLNILRRVLGPERDLMQALAGPHGPQLGDDIKLYLRDVYDHAVRITEQIDAYRDIVTGALDVYLSSVNNRLTEQTRRLTVVATVFLPLTFLTGFFGMNFSILVWFISHDWFFWVTLALMASSVPIGFYVSRRLSATAPSLPAEERRRGFAPRVRRRWPRPEVAVDAPATLSRAAARSEARPAGERAPS